MPAALHTYGAHATVLPGRQVPLPLHVPAVVRVPFAQRWGAHTVPAAYWRQPPLPLQAPSLPQLEAPWSRHPPWGSEAPAGTSLQVPIEPERLQA